MKAIRHSRIVGVLLAFLLAGLGGLSATAHAALINFEGSFNVDLSQAGSDPGLVVETRNHGNGQLGFSLGVGDRQSLKLFDIWTNESHVNRDDTKPQDIAVAFDFTAPDTFGGTVTGRTVGVAKPFVFFGVVQYGKVSWDAPIELEFGNGGLLQVALTGGTFNKGLFGLWPGEKLGLTVNGKFSLIRAPEASAAVPEPGTLLLLGLGLLLTGVFGLRRRTDNTC